jgi:tRNA dimethylallyltransferase
MHDARTKISELIANNITPIIVGGSGFFIQTLLGDRVLSIGNEEVPEKPSIDNRIYKAKIIGLNFENREILYERINSRVDLMLKEGMLDEVNYLYNTTKLQTQSSHAIGYSQFIPYFNGEQDLERTIELIKRDSRHFAKRQITFFSNQFNDIQWFDPSKNPDNDIKKLINDFLK